jgi:hypothetical protein
VVINALRGTGVSPRGGLLQAVDPRIVRLPAGNRQPRRGNGKVALEGEHLLWRSSARSRSKYGRIFSSSSSMGCGAVAGESRNLFQNFCQKSPIRMIQRILSAHACRLHLMMRFTD